MFIIKNKSQLEIEGVAVTIPRNSDVFVLPKLCCFRPHRAQFLATYEIISTKTELKQAMMDYHQGPFEIYAPLQPIEQNGLTGYEAIFACEREDRYVIWLSIDPTEEGDNIFAFTLRTHHGDIEQIKTSPAFKNLLSGIHKV